MSDVNTKPSSESKGSFVTRGAQYLFWVGAHPSVPGGPPGQWFDPGSFVMFLLSACVENYPKEDKKFVNFVTFLLFNGMIVLDMIVYLFLEP